MLVSILIAATAACSDAAFVEEIVIVNPSAYPADVEVGDGDGDWLTLGVVDPAEEKSFTSVIDQGDSWTFRFEYFGEHPHELVLARDELERTDWRVEIPDDFAEELDEEGIRPSP